MLKPELVCMQAAIFGKPAEAAAEPGESMLGLGQRAGLGARQPSPEPHDPAENLPVDSSVVQQQKAVSWRERAAQLKVQRQAT